MRAQQRGCRFDGWSECFNYESWLAAFTDSGVDPQWYAYQRYQYQDVLPWEHINAGVSKRYLALEHKKSLEEQVTVDCRSGKCPGCGLCPSMDIKPLVQGGMEH